MKAILAGAAALGLLALSPPALAADPAVTQHDVLCFLAVGALANDADPKLKSVAMMGGAFFSGKIFGDDPDIDLTAAARAAAPKLTPDAVKPLLASCGQEMAQRGQQVTEAAQALQSEAAAKAGTAHP